MKRLLALVISILLSAGAIFPQQESSFTSDASLNSAIDDINFLKSEQKDQKSAINELSNKLSSMSSELSKLHSSQKNQIQTLELISKKLSALQQNQGYLQNKLESLADGLCVLGDSTQKNGSLISKLEKELNNTRKSMQDSKNALYQNVDEVRQSAIEARSHLTVLEKQLGHRTVQFGVGALILAIIGGLGLLLGITIKKRYSKDSASMEDNLLKMRKNIDDEMIKVDSKLIEILDNQLKTPQKELDHTMPIKTGIEINRMRQRLKSMPDDTKGLKPLLKSLERLEDEFNQQGYELVEMLGEKYIEGINVEARFIPSDDLGPDERVITKVIIPQINYQGTAIQMAEIEVSEGE